MEDDNNFMIGSWQFYDRRVDDQNESGGILEFFLDYVW